VTCLAQDCYLGSEVPQLTEPSKNHLPRWFFRFTDTRLLGEKKDLKKILFSSVKRGSFPRPRPPVNSEKIKQLTKKTSIRAIESQFIAAHLISKFKKPAHGKKVHFFCIPLTIDSALTWRGLAHKHIGQHQI